MNLPHSHLLIYLGLWQKKQTLWLYREDTMRRLSRITEEQVQTSCWKARTTVAFMELRITTDLHKHRSPPSLDFCTCQHLTKTLHGRTFDWTSALWSFWRSRAADLVSSLRAAMCRAGRRTLPFVSFSNKTDTTWLWPCWSAMAKGVKPS